MEDRETVCPPHFPTLRIDQLRPPMLANEQRSWHWAKVRAAKQHAERLVYFTAKQQKLKPVAGRVDVRVTWYAPNNRKRDSDSLGPFVKAALDALVKAGVLPDDSHQFVRDATGRVEPCPNNPRIEIALKLATTTEEAAS